MRNSLFTAVKKSAGNNNKVLNDSSSLDELSETGHFAILSATPEDEVIDNEKIKELREKIYSSLSKRESEVLSLYLRGLTYAEIAEKTGKTVKAVDGILARSKLKIKNCIGD